MEKEKTIPPVPYKRFKEVVDKNRKFKLENTRLLAQIEILEKLILNLKKGLQNE